MGNAVHSLPVVETKVLPVGLPEPVIDRRLISPTGPSFEHPKSFSTVFSWLH